MPVVNIIDRRTNNYDVTVDACAEPAWHDNDTKNSGTQFEQIEHGWSIEDFDNTTVAEAIKSANALEGETTLYLYDKGRNDVLTDIHGNTMSTAEFNNRTSTHGQA